MSGYLLDTYPASSTIYCLFDTFAGSTGAPITMSGFATGDLKIYKNGSTTERASTSGFALLDTDGIDFDSITGIHGFSVDLSDNTTAGFYAAGSTYTIVISTITVDSQTMSFVVGTFRIVAAENTSGTPVVDVGRFGNTAVTGRDIGASVLLSTGTGTGQLDFTTGVVKANVTQFGGSAGTFASGRPEVNASHIAGSAVSTSSAQIGVNVVNAAGTAWGSGAITAASIAANAITSAKIATDAIGAAQIAADAIGASELAADAVAEIQSGLSTLNAAGIRSAVGLASANLDTQLDALPTAAENADAVWEEAIVDHSGTAGSTAEQLAAAGAAGDPWATALPGAYASGTAGKIVGDNLNATISSRATQTSVDTIDGIVDDILVDTGTTLDGRIPAALVSGRIDASVGAMAANVMTAAAAAADLTTELQSGLATASALSTVDSTTTAIKAKTDKLTFTSGNDLDANIQKINDVAITGDGSGTPFNV